MPTHPTPRSLLLLCVVLPLTGCLTTAGPDAQAPTEAGAPAADALPWRSTASANASFEVANGVPFSKVTWQGGCFDFEVAVPQGAGRLAIVLTGSAFDPGRSGAGYMTFQLRPEAGAWQRPASTAPVERVEVVVDDPASGTWQVWVWPNGPVVNQVWGLAAFVEGEGTPGTVTLQPTDAAC